MGSQDESSLAARRARLRGSLAKQALPPDPYSQDPYARAKTVETPSPSEPAVAAPEPDPPLQEDSGGGTNGGHGANNQASAQAARPNFRLEDLTATQPIVPTESATSSAQAKTANGSGSNSSATGNASSLSSLSAGLGGLGLGSLSESLKNLSRNPSVSAVGSSAVMDIADWSTAEPQSNDENDTVSSESESSDNGANGGNGSNSSASAPVAYGGDSSDFFGADDTQTQLPPEESSPAAAATAHSPFENEPIEIAPEHSLPSDQDFFSVETNQIETLPDEASVAEAVADIWASADLAKPDMSDDSNFAQENTTNEPAPPVISKEQKNKKGAKSAKGAAPIEEDEPSKTAPAPEPVSTPQAVTRSEHTANAANATSINLPASGPMHVIVDAMSVPTHVVVDEPAHVIVDNIGHVQVLDTLTNMDQAMGACAMNLSALQATANQQTEALRSLSETLQNQTFSELGMSLSGLMESLSAALEPMKAVSELVPAIDQLVQVMEAKINSEPQPEPKLSPDQLVMNLADQLSSGAIDPWTFKSAYMAVFPGDHPADLLHRLVDLLGTSRLSGNLFRAAYDAVQAPDPPKRAAAVTTTSEDGNTIVKVVQDESLVQQLEELRRSQNEFQEKMSSRESEFSEMLSSKEQELQDAQELLNSRWEEFNTRYDELSESLQKRDELIQEKETELARKESENGRLRNQMDELKDMVSELQKQFSASKARAEALSKPGFFDSAPVAGAAPSLFDAAPAKPLFQGEPQQHQHQPQQHQAPQPPQPVPIPAPIPQQQPAAMMPAPPQPAMSAPQADMSSGGMSAPPQMAAQPSQQAIPRQNQMTTPFAGAGPGSYGSGVRAQVFEVIVRQALAGAPWREICAGPMQVNNISPDEVEAEVKRRQALLKK